MAISAVTVWLDVIRKVAEALLHVHNTGFVHNDIKGNNRDNWDGIKYNPILIDFGKSLPATLDSCQNLLAEQQKRYKSIRTLPQK